MVNFQPLDSLVAYDTPCFPTERSTFLKNWITLPDSYGVAVLEEDRIGGYGMIRACREGYKIGPLFADAGKTVYFDVPEINEPGMAIAGRYGMEQVFGTGRIYMNGEPEVELGRVFGVTSFELGQDKKSPSHSLTSPPTSYIVRHARHDICISTMGYER